VTLRKLVDEERKRRAGSEETRLAREAAGKFMWVMAGNRTGFEEASRALYAKDRARLDALILEWPGDIRSHLGRLLDQAERLEHEAEVKNELTA
jgi:hypothetical protein